TVTRSGPWPPIHNGRLESEGRDRPVMNVIPWPATPPPRLPHPGEGLAQRIADATGGQQCHVDRWDERHQPTQLAGRLQHERAGLGDAPLRRGDARVAREQLVAREVVESLEREAGCERA